ncbi:MAG: glycosyltransferase [Nitrospirae bacterium]|nr:glycosyltransferase [Nitrospirota bacterium]
MRRPKQASDYDIWMNNFAFTEKKRNHVLSEIERLSYKPLISIATPVYNIEDAWLEKCIQSVLSQTYPDWELCIVDDASTREGIREVLQHYSKSDPRIKTKYLARNLHISGATNEALDMAGGEFVALLDHDDELHPNALFEVVNLLQSSKDADMIYTDNDMINTEGKRFNPKFKPDWSPELLLSYMYISHLIVCRTSLARKIGGFRKGYEGSQDHDMVLRLSERTNKIYHIPKILYHARTIPGSVSSSGDAKPYSFTAGTRAVQDAVDRRGISATVERPDFAVEAKLGIYKLNFMNIGNERVAIVIPTRDRVDLLKNCIGSIEAKTTYKNYEIIIADDGSKEEATLNYFKSIRHRVIHVGGQGPFNFSRIMNRAVMQVDHDIEYLLLLNNDIEVITGNWIEEMLGFMQTSEIGAVGAKLLYKDNKIQHGGIIVPLHEGLPGHAFKTLDDASMGYLFFAKVVRNYSAVTAACMLTRRSYFEEVGGFDEEYLNEAYNDVDYCLKLREKGYRVVYTPYAALYHYEGGSRGKRVPAINEYYFRSRWGSIQADPYFNPNVEGWLFQINRKAKEVIPVNRKIKLLFISHNLNCEGAPLSLFSVAKGLDKNKYEITVLSYKDGILREAFNKVGIEVFIYAINVSRISVSDFENDCKNMMNLISTHGIDVIFCNTLDTFSGVYMSYITNIPSIWCIRESVDVKKYFRECCHNAALEKLAQESFKIPTHIVFVSMATARLFGDVDNPRFRVIYNGLEIDKIESYKSTHTKSQLREEYCIPDKTKVVTIVGMTIPRKGQQVFTQAAITLLEKNSNLLFFIVGGREGQYYEDLQEMILKYGVGNQIRIIPETPDVFPYYRLSDIYVCASFEESFPRVILEAMAFQLPIVSTPVYGIQEQIEDKVSALLVPPGDPTLLSEKISLLLNNELYANELAMNAYYRVRNKFSYQTMVESYDRCIQESMFSGPNPYEFADSRGRISSLMEKLYLSKEYYIKALKSDGFMAGNKVAVKKIVKKLRNTKS